MVAGEQLPTAPGPFYAEDIIRLNAKTLNKTATVLNLRNKVEETVARGVKIVPTPRQP